MSTKMIGDAAVATNCVASDGMVTIDAPIAKMVDLAGSSVLYAQAPTAPEDLLAFPDQYAAGTGLAHTTDLVVPKLVETVIPYATSRWTTGASGLASDNLGTVTATVAGIYSVTAEVRIAGPTGGHSGFVRQLLVRVVSGDSSKDYGMVDVTSSGRNTDTSLTTTCVVSLQVGDTVQAVVYHNNNQFFGTDNLVVSSVSEAYLQGEWVLYSIVQN